MRSLPCADISNYSREDKDMLRGAGLMSQASGLGPASARTTSGAPGKVRLCRHRNCCCPLCKPAFVASQVPVASLSLFLTLSVSVCCSVSCCQVSGLSQVRCGQYGVG